MRTVAIKRQQAVNDVLPVNDEDVVIMRDGHAVALVTPFDDDDLEWYARERDPEFIESIRRAREQVAKGETVSHEELMTRLDRRDSKEMIDDLVQPRGAVSVDDAAELAPRSPGIYAIFLANPQSLPEPFRSHQLSRKSKLLYVGMASKSILRRMVEEDFKHKRPSSFFRSLGAILGFKPGEGSLGTKKNKYNFAFSSEDTSSISQWIQVNLRSKWVVLDQPKEELKSLESKLICDHRPLLNLSGNGQHMDELAGIRRECREIAK